MCNVVKQVSFVPLAGASIAEIEQAATAAINEGGVVVGFPTVMVGISPTPTMAVIRRAPQVAPQPAADDADDADEVV